MRAGAGVQRPSLIPRPNTARQLPKAVLVLVWKVVLVVVLVVVVWVVVVVVVVVVVGY
ncbi:hypothetical protein GCM10028817_32900 [Spirosoma pomorum]